MHKYVTAIILITMAASVGACRKVININHENSAGHIVIEGAINNRAATQTVTITTTYLLSDTSRFAAVTGGTVKVTDGSGKAYAFTERKPGIYQANMRGTPNTRYTLAVTLPGGNTYTAESTMPATVVVPDSIGTVNDNVLGRMVKSIGVYYHDPAGEKNYYRFVLTLNKQTINRLYLQDDRLTNGQKIRGLLFYNNGKGSNEEIKAGDTAQIEMRGIDKPAFTYLVGLSNVSNDDPSGLTPVNPVTNLSNGALGYFSAYTSQVFRYVVK